MALREGIGGASGGAVADAEVEVEKQADDEPDEEAYPVLDGEAGHQDEAQNHGGDGNPWRKWDAEAARAVGLAFAENQDGDRNEDEGEKRADVGEVDERADVENPGGNGDEKSGDPGGEVRRT